MLIISGTGASDRVSFALTRRMINQLWPGLTRIVRQVAPSVLPAATDSATNPKAPSAPATKADSTGHVIAPDDPPAAAARTTPPETAQAPANTEDSFDTLPPPTSHLLVGKLQLVDRGDQPRLLVLTSNSGTLSVPLENSQLGQVYAALRTLIERAQWDIDLDDVAPQPAQATPGTTEPTIDISADSPSRYRH